MILALLACDQIKDDPIAFIQRHGAISVGDESWDALLP